jgi:plastocyanin
LKKKLIAIGSIILAVSTFIAISFSSDNLEDENNSITTTITPDVVMPTKVSRPGCEKIDNCYVPTQIVIQKGETVTWENQDAAFHSVTSGLFDAPTELFDSGYLDPYEQFSFTFEEPGIYDYYCTLHFWMQGQVIVE